MGYKEKKLINEQLIQGSKNFRLFRVNSGMAWQGTDVNKLKKKSNKNYIENFFVVILKFLNTIGLKINKKFPFILLVNPRPFHGMPAGTADIIGWERKIVSAPCCGSCINKGCCNLLINTIKSMDFGLLELYDKLNKSLCEGKLYKPYHPVTIAIFIAKEVKTGNQKLTKEQQNWKRQLLNDGGIYEEIRE